MPVVDDRTALRRLRRWVSDRTPEEWADEIMAAAQLKRTKRPHLRPHLVAGIRRAIDADRTVREIDAQQTESDDTKSNCA